MSNERVEIIEQLPRAEIFIPEQGSPIDAAPLRIRNVGAAMLDAFVGEQTYGKAVKTSLQAELTSLIDATPHYQGDQEGDQDLLAKKLLRFRPRLVGAVGAYCHLTGQSYEGIIKQGGLENFYLFWAQGSIQDDFIDELPKQVPIPGQDPEAGHKERRAQVAQSIFGEDRRFYRATFHLLRERIQNADLGTEQTGYALSKISDWYQFLINQEANVLATPFKDLTFDVSRTYREEQNRRAGTALVALLNGRNCLDPRFMAVEEPVAEFSFMTQIIDDIADTSEDLGAQRPSYAVGALVDHPKEMECMQAYMDANPNAKVTPGQFRRIAPESFAQVHAAFNGYADDLRISASRGIATLGKRMFRYFPHIRNGLYHIDPKYANF